MIGGVNATFLTVGEALTDIVSHPGQEPVEHPGGSPMNVAVALGRLGYPSYLLTHIGDDARGRRIREHVEASHVSLTPGSVATGRTSTALATLDASGAADYVFDLAWDPDPRDLPEHVDAVHASSIATVLEPGRRVIPEVFDRYRTTSTISYDPNARPDIMGDPADVRPIVEDLVRRADVVKSSDEDIAWLYGTDDLEDVAATWHDLGPTLVAMTRGGDGTVAFGPTGRIEVPSETVEVADTVGAGDTFSAGLLWGLARHDLLGASRRTQFREAGEDTLRDVLSSAARLAAVTVSRPGANPPWADEIA
jgi:fructokinase